MEVNGSDYYLKEDSHSFINVSFLSFEQRRTHPARRKHITVGEVVDQTQSATERKGRTEEIRVCVLGGRKFNSVS